MPVIHRIGDLLEQKDLHIIGHQANLYHTFGKGIARQIKEKFPEAYEADLTSIKGDRNKLGTYTFAFLNDRPGQAIFNCYTQTGMGAKDRNTCYESIEKLFTHIEQECVKSGWEYKIGVPYRYGAGLAGGDWDKILKIFREIFDNSPVTLVICQRPGDI